MRIIRHSACRGFSLIEGVITVSLVGLVCGLAFLVGGSLKSSAEVTKLEQDVRTVNAAAKLFLANGGSFEGLTDPQQILDRMKTAHSATEQMKFVGMPGATLDKRIIARPARNGYKGFAAVWDPATKQFVIEKSVDGAGSVFGIDESLAEVTYADQERKSSAFEYDDKPGWIWKYVEVPPTYAGGPSIIPVSTVPDPVPPPRPVRLQPPNIVLSDPAFNGATPGITVTISNPNPSGSSALYYSIVPTGNSHGPSSVWAAYSGPVTTFSTDYPDGFEVVSYAKATDTRFLDSNSSTAATTSEFYGTPAVGNVLFVVDASSSMNASFGSMSRFEATVLELISAIQGLPHNIKFNVAMFDQGIHWTDGTFRLHPANQRNKLDLIAQIEQVDNDRGTNYSVALDLPTQFTPIPDQVILLSDGEPNNNGFLTQLQTLVSLGVRVDTIGLNAPGNGRDVLQLIADETGGTMQLIAD